ncbi:MAG: helix-turn-helix domain-containing protein [Promethearchaeota archaeon]
MTTLNLNLPILDEIKSRLEVIDSKLESIQKSKSSNKDWLTNQEAAKILDVTLRTLQNYRDKGILPFSQVGSKIYYKVADIKKHLEGHYVKSFNK